eukprot:5118231-Karenia_brevis.AAC.1
MKAFPGLTWKPFFENVDSAPLNDVDKVIGTLKMKPFQFEAGHIGWNRRPRLYWFDWDIPE